MDKALTLPENTVRFISHQLRVVTRYLLLLLKTSFILDPIIPEPLEITCENCNVTLSAENSTYPSSSVEYKWYTDDENIVSGQGIRKIIVDKARRYLLNLIDDDRDIYCELSSRIKK